MPFTKVGKDDYTSPSGRHFNTAQVRLWHANGNKFPGQKTAEYERGGAVNKGFQGKVESFAQGGAVLGRTKDFIKQPDRFSEGKFRPKPETTDDVFGKGVGHGKEASGHNPAPPAKGKSLKAVVPHK